MMKPSLDNCKASSIQSCEERTRAFSHHSDARPACKIWAGIMCTKFSVEYLGMMATYRKEAKDFLVKSRIQLATLVQQRVLEVLIVEFQGNS